MAHQTPRRRIVVQDTPEEAVVAPGAVDAEIAGRRGANGLDLAGYRVYRRLSTTQWAKTSGSSAPYSPPPDLADNAVPFTGKLRTWSPSTKT
ncbi:hypothetical protein [Streptomyces agglomeratus]|uniref:hypothetical protein n=1 Tax=Streptomyces agglomeratus TaxID=285458 RepID=UPI00159F2928|nr:hypothetical protein [Streptomyces agglomeratus]